MIKLKNILLEKSDYKWVDDLIDDMKKISDFKKYWAKPDEKKDIHFKEVPVKLFKKHFGLSPKEVQHIDMDAISVMRNGKVDLYMEGKSSINEYGAQTSELEGTSKGPFGQIYNMKEDMKEGKFDPKDPQVHIHGFGVYTLKTLEKAIARDLKRCIGSGAEFTAGQLYRKHSTTEAKIKAANDVYKQMETSQYKRAVTMYKKKR